MSLDLARDRQGLSVSVAPSYGRTAGGVDRLWDGGAAAVAPTIYSAAQGSVDARLSYGWLVAEQTLITPYGGIRAVEDGTRRYQVGGKLEFGPAFSLDLAGEHHMTPSGIANPKVSIEGTIRL